MPAPFISLLTDFGVRDASAVICHGVILRIAPDATIVDVGHEVPKYSVRDGAYLLWCAVPYLPVGVHMAVVDPGVGTERLPVAVQVARGDVLVGPDNGLLLPAAERLGGIVAARVLEEPRYRLDAVSTSFHGRDIFAPAAAHLSLGVPLAAFGRSLDPADLVRLPTPRLHAADGRVETAVVYLDTFGNVKFSAMADDLRDALGPLHPGDRLLVESPSGASLRLEVPWVSTFGDLAPGEALLYEDSYARTSLAVDQGDAAARFGLGLDDVVTIRRP